jgi:hypothetical protein
LVQTHNKDLAFAVHFLAWHTVMSTSLLCVLMEAHDNISSTPFEPGVPLVAFFCCASPATHNNNSLSCV